MYDESIKKNITTNSKINNDNNKVTSLNKNRKIKSDNFLFNKQKSYNNRKEP